jgi:hypothetical protein
MSRRVLWSVVVIFGFLGEAFSSNVPRRCREERKAIEGIVEKFQNFQKKKEGRLVVALMTRPTSTYDIDVHDFLSGVDIAPEAFRLYGTGPSAYTVRSFKIEKIMEATENRKSELGGKFTCMVEVRENRTYPPHGDYTVPSVKTTVTTHIEVVSWGSSRDLVIKQKSGPL